MRIIPLHDVPHLADAVAGMITQGWPDHYGPSGPGDAPGDVAERCRQSGLPFGVVALDGDDVVIGTAALADTSYGAMAGEGHWITGLFVPFKSRGQGVASALVGALEAHARGHGCKTLFTTTAAAEGLFCRLGWQVGRTLAGDQGSLKVLRKTL